MSGYGGTIATALLEFGATATRARVVAADLLVANHGSGAFEGSTVNLLAFYKPPLIVFKTELAALMVQMRNLSDAERYFELHFIRQSGGVCVSFIKYGESQPLGMS